MGFLTPILIRNDSLNAFTEKEMQQQICEKIYDACQNGLASTISFHYPGGSIDCNPIESLGTRHASQDSVIVIMGNTWIDLNKIHQCENKEYLEKCIEFAEKDIRRLKKRLKGMKNGS